MIRRNKHLISLSFEQADEIMEDVLKDMVRMVKRDIKDRPKATDKGDVEFVNAAKIVLKFFQEPK